MTPHDWIVSRTKAKFPEHDMLYCIRCNSVRFADWSNGPEVWRDVVAMHPLEAAVTDPNDDCDLRICRKVMES